MGGLRREKTAFSLVHGLNGPQTPPAGNPQGPQEAPPPPPPPPGLGSACPPSRPLTRFSEKRLQQWAWPRHLCSTLLQKMPFHVASEEDIFGLLGLEYLPPEQRNA